MDTILTILTFGLVRFVFVEEGTNVVVMRFGKYKNTLQPGLRGFLFVWGLFGYLHHFEITDVTTAGKKSAKAMNMREQVFDYRKETIISKDNVQFDVDCIIYFKVIDPFKAIFGVTDYTSSMQKLVQSILRAEMGKHDLEETYSNREAISKSLTNAADIATDPWGISVIRLEIKEFDLGEFAGDLLKQKQQEIEKRQQILLAEGDKEAKIKEAEGNKESEVLKAEGHKIAAIAEAEAVKTKAMAEAEAKKMLYDAECYGYRIIADVLNESPDVKYYLKLHNANAISKNLSEGNATKLFLPNQIDQLVSGFSVLADTIKKTTQD
jgi:regulator of protease activity HflC (stomatin/prohibitin superfamily)